MLYIPIDCIEYHGKKDVLSSNIKTRCFRCVQNLNYLLDFDRFKAVLRKMIKQVIPSKANAQFRTQFCVKLIFIGMSDYGEIFLVKNFFNKRFLCLIQRAQIFAFSSNACTKS